MPTVKPSADHRNGYLATVTVLVYVPVPDRADRVVGGKHLTADGGAIWDACLVREMTEDVVNEKLADGCYSPRVLGSTLTSVDRLAPGERIEPLDYMAHRAEPEAAA